VTRTFGGVDLDYGYCVRPTSPRPLHCGGLKRGPSAMALRRLRGEDDADGWPLWTRTYGGTGLR